MTSVNNTIIQYNTNVLIKVTLSRKRCRGTVHKLKISRNTGSNTYTSMMGISTEDNLLKALIKNLRTQDTGTVRTV